MAVRKSFGDTAFKKKNGWKDFTSVFSLVLGAIVIAIAIYGVLTAQW